MKKTIVSSIVAILLLAALSFADGGRRLPADISGPTGSPDGTVNFLDFVGLANEWLVNSDPPGSNIADINVDGIVDFGDLIILSSDWLSSAPQAFIDLISPNPADVNAPVTFTGHGTDSDGTITAYQWKIDDVNISSEPNFVISTLVEGVHNISFAVQDNGGIWSVPITQTLTVQHVVVNIAPQAFIDSISPNPADVNAPVTFIGHGTDSDGTITAYQWKIDDVNTNNEPNFVISTLAEGVHNISFAVKDNAGIWSVPITQTLTVQHVVVNIAPQAFIDSISPNPADVNAPVTFIGHGTDSDGTITAYQWKIDDVNISSEPNFVISTLAEGVHNISFAVKDNAGIWSVPITQTLTVQHVVVNIAPQAFIDSISPNPADVNAPVTFIGHGTDSDGTITAHRWKIDDVNTSNEPNFVISTLVEGVHNISFAVQDNGGIWSVPITQTLTVQHVVVNIAPQAFIDSISPNPADVNAPVTFIGHGTDSDGTITAYQWKIDDVNASTEATFTVNTFAEGVYTVSFAVQDNSGIWSEPLTQILTVRHVVVNIVPQAFINSILPNPADVNTLVTFTGHGIDSDGTIIAYQWKIDDVNTSTEATFTVNTFAEGVYTVSFAVQDNTGIWSIPMTQTLTVQHVAANNSPQAFIDSLSPNPADTNTPVTFTGHGEDSDGTIIAYQWKINDVNASTEATFTVNTFAEGIHTVLFAVRDNAGIWSEPLTQILTVRHVVVNIVPQAFINSILPNPADANTPVTFTGHGTDSDGEITAYRWKIDDANTSNEPNFVISTLAEGVHTISFAVQDNAGVWSEPITQILTVRSVVVNILPQAFIDSISPNPATRSETVVFTGHGTDSDGNVVNYKWETNAHGEVSDQPSFSISAASLGAGIYTVTFRSQDDKGAWSAPATQSLTVGNVKPTAYIDSITPPAANVGELVTFIGHGGDVDGSVVAYSWDSSIDGHLSDANSFSTTALSLGDHIITFTVTDNNEASSSPVAQEVVVNEAPIIVIIDNGKSGTSSTGIWQVSAAAGAYPPPPASGNSLYGYGSNAEYRWSYTPTSAGVYRVSMWWTALTSRRTNVPIMITHAGGTANTTVNQTQNGGQWNSLGEYTLNSGTACIVRITAPSTSPPSTCADAVKFEKVSQPSPPIANFSTSLTTGGVPLTVQFTDNSLGIIASRLWNFGDGTTSVETNPTHTYSAVGKYTVSLTVTNAAGSNALIRQDYIETVSDHENIYVCGIYSWNNGLIIYTESMLQDIGATKISTDHWRYTARGRTYFINMVRTVDGMVAALKEEGSHVVTAGHSNFGFGAVFATSNELRDQEILDIRYVDDNRFVKFSSDMVSVKPDGMKYGQAYPNWTPTRKDGTSAVMPYTFAEAKAKGTLPPYNYYMTYKRPGDPNVYKVELTNGSYLQRFPDSGVPAWYSSTGTPPDPCLNPEYFIVNDDPDYNRFETIGTWPMAKVMGGGYMGEAGYLGYNYQYHDPGTGANKAKWTSYIRTADVYVVMASWFPSPLNATNARFTINSPAGPVVVDVNQRTSAPLVNVLGAVYLTPGSWTVELTDAANGRVCADAIVLNPLSNPQRILTSEFRAIPQSGAAPLTVNFASLASSYSLSSALGGIKTYHWDFGDGTFSNLPQPSHTYTAAGRYTVSLTISDDPNNPSASVTKTKMNFITVGMTPELRAQFTASNRFGPDKTTVYFENQSTGTITSWHWEFGDGTTSNQQAPMHVYTIPGPYTVSLTVSGPDGSDTHTEAGFIYNLIGLIFTDNTFIEKPHYYSRSGAIVFGKLICDTSGTKIPNEDMKYARLFMGSCNSANYFTGAFNRGIYFCTTADIYEYTAKDYLKDYLYRGWNDPTILQHMNEINPGHEYVNFNLKPPSMR